MLIEYNYFHLPKAKVKFKFGSKVLTRLGGFVYAIRKIFGIGLSRAKYIAASMGFGMSFPIIDLTIYDYDIMLSFLKGNFILDKRLEEVLLQRLEYFWDNGCVRGKRMWIGLPCNGQRTKSNAGSPARTKPFSPRLTPLVREHEAQWLKHAQKRVKVKGKKK